MDFELSCAHYSLNQLSDLKAFISRSWVFRAIDEWRTYVRSATVNVDAPATALSHAGCFLGLYAIIR